MKDETQQPDTIVQDPVRDGLKGPVTGIFIILFIHALIMASGFLLPVTAAILGYLVLAAPRRVLERLGLPAPLIAALFTIILASFLAIALTALAEPVSGFVTNLPTLMDRAMASLTGPGGPLEPFTRAAEATREAVANSQPDEPVAKVEVVSSGSLATSIFSAAPGMMSQIIFAICLLYFLVASGDMFIQKAVQVTDRFRDKRATLAMVHRIERGLGNYLGAITLINMGLGLCIGTTLWLLGAPSPWLLGLMAAALNFVPFVGAVLGACVAGVVAFVGVGDLWFGVLVMACYYALTALEGQFITPTLVGHRLRLNTTMVFLSVAFFAWIWSVMGMVVAVPMLIVAKVVCDSVPRLRKVGLFLGDAEGFGNGRPSALPGDAPSP